MKEAAQDPRNFLASSWGRAGVGLAAVAAVVFLWSAWCTVPGVPWNPPRLAPSFALARGLPIYALRDSGAQLGWFYGPAFPLWYLPVAFTDNPTAGLVMAAALNTATILGPLLLVLWAAGVRDPRRLGVAGILALLLFLGHDVMHQAFYFVHVDPVCIALTLAGALALRRAAEREAPYWLHAAALAFALACWTKQIGVVAYPAAVCWLVAEGRGRVAGRFLVWCALYGALASALVLRGFGAGEVLFNTVVVHLHNPWRSDAGNWGSQAADLVLGFAPWLPLAAWLVWAPGRSRSAAPGAGSLVRLLAWLAAWAAPAGLMAMLRSGGAANSLHALAYLFTIALVWAADRLGTVPAPATSRSWIGPAWVLAIAVLAGTGWWEAARHGLRWAPYRGQEGLLAQARAQPGRFYFPWNPLVTIIADRRVQPLDDALYCLWHVNMEVPADKVRSAVPPSPIIIYEEPAQSHFALRYFPHAGGKPAQPLP